MVEKGIKLCMQAKRRWFEGINTFQSQVKTLWTDAHLLNLWTAGDDEYEDEVKCDGFETVEFPTQVMGWKLIIITSRAIVCSRGYHRCLFFPAELGQGN